ncbi:MAG TPA: A/G-specific adenine glycosylase [Bacteroidota bacterium]|nr:A/G-specific adenine glycosylase [Bacteroidota bacterium]
MLQQTQVSRVLWKYPEFLRKYSTFKKLAESTPADAIRAWRGMGYNNRVLRLRSLSQVVVRKYRGKLPEDVHALESLPGIGKYTARAVACFAFGKQVAVVDTNVERVLRRLYPERIHPKRSTPRDIWDVAADHLPRGRAHDWNQGLMDFGAMICTAVQPRCKQCPLNQLCPSAHKVSRHPRLLVPRKEPGRAGIPNRIYRGKTVEALRTLSAGSSMSTLSLARIIVPDFSVRDRAWFQLLLKNLEHDGMVRFRGRNRISLPDEGGD